MTDQDPMQVRVTVYNPEWAAQFEAEALKIRAVLGAELLAVHHIGSTAVPGLSAKPVIDIMPVVRDITRLDSFTAAFADLGYEAMGEYGIPGRRYFRKGGALRTHQIHAFQADNRHDIERHLAVRDYLRACPDLAGEYGALKMRLAQQHPDDLEAYWQGKAGFVSRLERDALAWARKAGRA